MVKILLANAGDAGSIPGLGRSLEEEMATHSSILSWEIPWTEEPGGLQFMGLKEPNATEQQHAQSYFENWMWQSI